jgi:hypothetical protein
MNWRSKSAGAIATRTASRSVASTNLVTDGSTVTLNWQVVDAVTNLVIDNGVGSVLRSDHQWHGQHSAYAPAWFAVTYTLTANGVSAAAPSH